jgi:hypothetical protein
MGNVGGDPGAMTGGAQDLHAAGVAVHAMEGHLSGQAGKAAGGVGDSALAAAISRFGAAWSTVLGDTGTQVLAASQLAANAAADLRAAGSGPRPR